MFCGVKRRSEKHARNTFSVMKCEFIIFCKDQYHMTLVFLKKFFERLGRVALLLGSSVRANLGGSKVTRGSNPLDDGFGISSSSTTFLGLLRWARNRKKTQAFFPNGTMFTGLLQKMDYLSLGNFWGGVPY